jgi:hypothetical protein
MKTTIDIAEAVLNDAKRLAAAEGTTLRALIEDGLRRVLAERERRAAFRLRRTTFGGAGLQPHVAEGSWQQIRELAYEGRGA